MTIFDSCLKTNKPISARGDMFVYIVYGSKAEAVDHWLSQHDSLNKFDLCVMLSIWIKFEAELNTQCRWQWSNKLYLYLHCKTNAYKSLRLPAYAHKMHKQSQQQRSPNESMFTCIVHAMHMVFSFEKKKWQTLCLNRTDNPFSTSLFEWILHDSEKMVAPHQKNQ